MKKGLPPDIVLLLMNYLCNQYGRIIWQGKKGEYQRIPTGVRQGEILSPMLFKLYMDNILKEFGQVEKGCQLGPYRLNILAYADDVAILANNENNLVEFCIAFEERIEDLKLTVNQDV